MTALCARPERPMALLTLNSRTLAAAGPLGVALADALVERGYVLLVKTAA